MTTSPSPFPQGPAPRVRPDSLPDGDPAGSRFGGEVPVPAFSTRGDVPASNPRTSGETSASGVAPRGAGRGLEVEVVGALVVVAAMAAVAGMGFLRVFEPRALAPVAGVAAVAPVLLAALTRRLPLRSALAAQLVVWVLTVSATLFHTTAVAGFLPSPATAAAVAEALLNSWRALLTTILPAPAEPALLVVAHLLVWLAGAAGAELALRSRTRSRVLPALPAVVVFAVAVAVGVNGPGSVMPVAGVLLGLVAALAVVRGERGLLRSLAAVPVAAALGLAGVLVAPSLPLAREVYDPRTLVDEPPVTRFGGVSPLDRVSAWLQVPTTPMFTMRASHPENWRLAVLDRYDGVRWTSSSQYRMTGGPVPPGPYRGEYVTVEQAVTLEGLPGGWLPAADRPVSVSGIRVAVDESGTLLSAPGGAPGRTYQVTSYVPVPSAERRRDATPAGAPPALPPKVGVFRSLAERVTRNARSPYQQASLLEHYLRTRQKYDVTSPPGHSLAVLEYFLRTTHRGTSEQFAASFALLARTLGLPSRVVVGFRPGTPGSDGAYHVASGDVLAWPEIEFRDLGWTAFDPTPERGGARAGQDVVSTEVKERERLAEQLQSAPTNAPTSAPSPSPKPRTREDARPSWASWQVAGAGAVAAVLLYCLAVVVVPVLRRRRRRRGDPVERVRGAWRQVREDLGLAGEAALTASEVAARGLARVGPEISPHIGALVELVNRAEFAGRDVGPGTPEESWRHADAVRALVRRGTPPLRRLGRRLHPRVLRQARPRARRDRQPPGPQARDRDHRERHPRRERRRGGREPRRVVAP
ncbi:hypothetical protein DQ384_20415 [Sphaerisporangium album]|uniref:Transglutaminase-like domain-containing protein n=1 Tax=Sphaerisporangium album TaxID=509200 RepID=A0A367FGB2_9ACTN|nr:DUF3488 and transglutaminase-like domain-containing protein [Sphaerisporangium album]RCG29416.1 hypothetical protein DQ384_20415 [Sphaerisporangium album]